MLREKIKSYRESKSATVSKYESGTLEPNIESLKKLAEIFEVSVDELLNDEQDRFDISKINVLNILREQKEMKLKGNLYHNTQIIFAYNTNYIEGSKLTEDQTRYIFETNTILFEGETIASVDDILEMANHFKLVDYMLDKAEENLTEDMIKEFHRLLKEGTADSRKEWFKVGDYKQVVNEAGSTKTTSPKYVQRDMTKLMDWYNSLSKITIKEITEDCGVNRQTFYYHFKDIYDLLEWIYKNEVIQEIEEKTKQGKTNKIKIKANESILKIIRS